MKAQRIEAIARQRLGDQTKPYLYETADIIDWIAEGEDEAAIRASLLRDDASAFTEIPLQDGERSYPLDERINRIDCAALYIEGSDRPRRVDLIGVDAIAPRNAFEVKACGRVQRAAHAGRSLQVWPTPRTGQLGTIKLIVYRSPLRPVCKLEDSPEIDPGYHKDLVDWVLYRAYSTKDGELYDPQRAAQALADFVANFGERDDADTRRRHNERRRVTTCYPGP